MKRRGLTRNEKLSATLQLQDIETAIGRLLMETLNGKIATADLDRLNWIEIKVRAFRYKLEDYPEIDDRLKADERQYRLELEKFWRHLEPILKPWENNQ